MRQTERAPEGDGGRGEGCVASIFLREAGFCALSRDFQRVVGAGNGRLPSERRAEGKSIWMISDILSSCQAGWDGEKRLKGFSTLVQRMLPLGHHGNFSHCADSQISSLLRIIRDEDFFINIIRSVLGLRPRNRFHTLIVTFSKPVRLTRL